MKRFQYKKSQQLVEFLLVVPFMVIMLGVLTEYAYALNIKMTLTQGLKTTTSSIYKEINPAIDASAIKTLVEDNFKTYLSANNVPINAENKLNVGYVINGQTTIFMARYTYIPAFTLPNVYFKIMPDKFDFLTTSAIPTAFLSSNNYDSSITSTKLDGVWSSTADFSSQDAFDASKKGIMKEDSASNGRNKMLFLVPNASAKSLLGNPAYTLVSWDGTILKSGTNSYNLNSANGNLYTCSALACTFTGTKFLNYAKTNNYYNIIFVHDYTLASISGDLSTLSSYWILPAGSTDLSPSTVDGILKRTLALIDSDSSSIGNYDNLYGGAYQIKPFGSMIFVYNLSEDTLSNIIISGAEPTQDYDFGS